MGATVVERAVWRRFDAAWLERAVAHVTEGGYAAVVGAHGKVLVLLPLEANGRLAELSRWALLAIEIDRFRRVVDGAAKGLAAATVDDRYRRAVLDWCERDAVHPGPTRRLRLDCVACAACCREADVVLDKRDLVKWRAAGRAELGRSPYIKRSADGLVRLRFIADDRCPHLASDRRCRIYELRPENCAAFLTGSEACLAAREETLGLRDGDPPRRLHASDA